MQLIVETVTVMPVTSSEMLQAQPVTKPLDPLKVHLVQLFTFFDPWSNTLYPVNVYVSVTEFMVAIS